MHKSSLKELFKEARRLYFQNIGKIIALAAMICLPIQLLSWFTDYRLNNIDQLLDIAEQWTAGTIDEELYTALLQNGVGNYYIYILLVGVISILGTAFSLAVIKITLDRARWDALEEEDPNTVVIYEQDSREAMGVSDYFSFAARRLPKYAWTALVGGVFAIGGFFLCFFPGILAMLVSLFTVYAVAATPLWGARAFRYAAGVLRQRPVLILLYVVFALIQEFLVSAVFYIPSRLSFPLAAECIFTVLLSCVLQAAFAFFDVVITLVFMDTVRAVPALAEAAKERNERKI